MKLLIMLTLLMAQNVSSSFIKWSDKKLTKDDFVPNSTMQQAASTVTGIMLITRPDSTAIAESFFDRATSYIRPSLVGQKLDYIIAHEQGHFDLTEYVTRRCNLVLRHIHDKRLAAVIHEFFMKELETIQTQYDKDTEHSMNEKQQDEWNKTIKSLLFFSRN